MRFAARFRHGFREIGEQDGKPQPERDLNAKQKTAGARDRVLDDVNRRQGRADFDDKHHRVLRNLHRVELHERLFGRAPHDFRIEQRARSGAFGDERRSLLVSLPGLLSTGGDVTVDMF